LLAYAVLLLLFIFDAAAPFFFFFFIAAVSPLLFSLILILLAVLIISRLPDEPRPDGAFRARPRLPNATAAFSADATHVLIAIIDTLIQRHFPPAVRHADAYIPASLSLLPADVFTTFAPSAMLPLFAIFMLAVRECARA